MRTRAFPLAVALILAVPACTPTASVSPSASPGPDATASPAGELREVRLLLGFRPDVQFAPFYLAQQDGYFERAGLEVTIEHASGGELIRLVADGQAEFGVADATDVMIARTSGIPIKYVSTLYQFFPVALIGPKGTVPTDPPDLAGLRIGTPGRFGSSWHALLALLDAGGLTPDDVTIREYPQFNQVEGLLNGDVDLITGFRNNEPLRLAAEGMETDLLTVDEIAPLPGPGVIVGDDLLAADLDLVHDFATAYLLAQEVIVADPQIGLRAAVEKVPTIAEDEATALAVLEATIPVWQGYGVGIRGTIDSTIWCPGYQTLLDLGFIDGSVPLAQMIDIRVTGAMHGTFSCQ
ncbi:MAG: ABC transporter substrate-binding protein [Candidatus Limnocylindria bacterium]